MAEATLRRAKPADLAALTEIYNHYIRETPITFDLDPYTPEQRQGWFEQFAEKGPYRLWVAVEGERVMGYTGSMRFRPKGAYATTVETSVYLDPEATGLGLGTRLYQVLFDDLEAEDVHLLVAGVTQPNPASDALHRHFGFEPVGTFREVGFKLDRYWDVVWYQKLLVG